MHTGPAGQHDRPPSLRARVVRRALIAGAWLMRTVGAGGAPEPTAPDSELEDYALRMRDAAERAVARLPATRGVRWREDADGPVPGAWVLAEEAAAGAADAHEAVLAGRVLLHLHGGAYCLGSPATHRGLAAALSRTARAAVFLPDYRLAPEHPFPAALDDAYASWRWLTGELSIPADRIALGGDSAGGGLAASLLVRLRDEGGPLPACYVGMSPWTDLAGTGTSLRERDAADPWLSAAMVGPAARAYAGTTALDDPRVSPLYADLTGLPAVLVHVGSDEILLDDAARFVEACRDAGVDASLGRFEGLWHVFQAFPGMPESRDALREIGAFVRRHIPDTHDAGLGATV